MTEPDRIPLPWEEIADHGLANCRVFHYPTRGYVTVDMGKRIYGIGMSTPRTWREGIKYSGKGWDKRIINDAMQHLASFWEVA